MPFSMDKNTGTRRVSGWGLSPNHPWKLELIMPDVEVFLEYLVAPQEEVHCC